MRLRLQPTIRDRRLAVSVPFLCAIGSRPGTAYCIPMTMPGPDSMEDPRPDDLQRVARNKLLGRIMILGFGLLVLVQVAPMLIRMFRHLPA